MSRVDAILRRNRKALLPRLPRPDDDWDQEESSSVDTDGDTDMGDDEVTVQAGYGG